MAKKRNKLTGPKKSRSEARVVGQEQLLSDLRKLIHEARTGVAQAVNSALVLLYWQVGDRIRIEILKSKRAAYGDEILSTLSKELVAEYGGGYSVPNLSRMTRLAEYFPDRHIVAALSRQLSWSHFVEIIPLRDDLKREFYAEMCRIERWSVRTLRRKIAGMLYERTALSRKPDQLIRQELAALREEDKLSPDLVFRDPYFLDFLGLKNTYSEKDLESAILQELETFILELGAGFTFVARQKRITVDSADYYLDLLFFHRKLRRLVVIELKMGAFQAADKGQMELYLRWLERYEMEPGEEPPLGLILCADKSDEHVELLQLERSGIRVAAYLTELPPKKLLERKLRQTALQARARFEGGPATDSDREPSTRSRGRT
jgi:predicted nuclease of restriction endonuclease-like (RecB) superfamily